MAKQSVTFRLSDALVPELEAAAEAHGVPRATYIQQIIEIHLRKEHDADNASRKLLEEVSETQQLLRTILQDTNLLKQIVAQKVREQSREFANLSAQQKALRQSLATAMAGLFEVVCNVSPEEAIAWTKECMNR